MRAVQLDVEAALREVEAILRRSLDGTGEPELHRMAAETVFSGGKRLRPRVMLLSYLACEPREPRPELLEAAAGIELIHAATLVHDDIMDRSPTRRGRPAVQAAHGPDRAIVAGDFLFVQGFALSARQDATVIAETARACTKLAEGQLRELQALADGHLDLPRYVEIIGGKTAAPLEACGRVGAHFAGRDDLMDALGAYGRHLGLAFQVTDDLLDVRGDPAVTGKPRGNDLRNRAPNAAVVLGLTNGARARLEGLLRDRMTEAEVEAALDTLLQSGAVADAERLAAEFAARAVESLAALPPSAAKRELEGLVRALPRRAA
ncbi:MAG TPA: polyprenyl synthetase family protein [Candidatus Thermoplasmatota archaeon]|jgi:geranylgeranyl pyrophosphate synthase|nr:polyprenyl synthetase family protein [Candidatus Thermoplasmatota archaeon]